MQEKKLEQKPGKKLLDSQGRLFGLISIIDVVVVLLVIFLGVGLYMKVHVLEASGGKVEDVGIEVTILMEIVPEYLVDSIQVGDELYDHDHATGGAIGVVTSKEILPPDALVSLNDGTYSRVTAEEGVNIQITVVGKGTNTNGRFSFNRVYELGVNASRYFQSKYSLFIGTVTEIREVPIG